MLQRQDVVSDGCVIVRYWDVDLRSWDTSALLMLSCLYGFKYLLKQNIMPVKLLTNLVVVLRNLVP